MEEIGLGFWGRFGGEARSEDRAVRSEGAVSRANYAMSNVTIRQKEFNVSTAITKDANGGPEACGACIAI